MKTFYLQYRVKYYVSYTGTVEWKQRNSTLIPKRGFRLGNILLRFKAACKTLQSTWLFYYGHLFNINWYYIKKLMFQSKYIHYTYMFWSSRLVLSKSCMILHIWSFAIYSTLQIHSSSPIQWQSEGVMPQQVLDYPLPRRPSELCSIAFLRYGLFGFNTIFMVSESLVTNNDYLKNNSERW